MADEKLYNVKFINLERKGEAHMWSSNGEIFDIKHGEVKRLPLHAINALKDAINVQYKMNDININSKPEKYDDPRFHVEILSEADPGKAMSEKEKTQGDVIDDILKSQQGDK